MDLRTSKVFLTTFGQCINVLNYNLHYATSSLNTRGEKNTKSTQFHYFFVDLLSQIPFNLNCKYVIGKTLVPVFRSINRYAPSSTCFVGHHIITSTLIPLIMGIYLSLAYLLTFNF